MKSIRAVLALLFVYLIAFGASAQPAKLSKETIIHRQQAIQQYRSGSISKHFSLSQKLLYPHSSTITTAHLGSISGTVKGLDSKALSTAYVEAFSAGGPMPKLWPAPRW